MSLVFKTGKELVGGQSMVTMVTSQEGPEEKRQMQILGCGNGDENGCPYESILCLETKEALLLCY